MQYKTHICNTDKYKILQSIHRSENIVDWSLEELNTVERNPNNRIRYLFDDSDKLVGVYILKSISSEYIEISLILVLEEFRGFGYGKQLLMDCLKDNTKKSSIYTASRNPIVKSLLLKFNFKIVPIYSLPISIIFFFV